MFFFVFFQDLLLEYYLSLRRPSQSYLPVLENIIGFLMKEDSCEANRDSAESTTSADNPVTPDPADENALSPEIRYEQDSPPLPQTYKAPWWTYIRDKCEASTSLEGYLHIALACRSLCTKETDKLSTTVWHVS